MLELPPPPFPIPTLLDLTFAVDKLWDLWKVKVILVSFCKLNFNQTKARNASQRMNPRFCYFFHLGIIGPPELVRQRNKTDHADLEILSKLVDDIAIGISFYGPYLGHVLKDEYRQAIIQEYKNT
jgi:hypothetical protein